MYIEVTTRTQADDMTTTINARDALFSDALEDVLHAACAPEWEDGQVSLVTAGSLVWGYVIRFDTPASTQRTTTAILALMSNRAAYPEAL